MMTAPAPSATPQNAPAAPPAAPAPAVHQDWPVRIVVALIGLLIAAGLVCAFSSMLRSKQFFELR
ncbi:hypothetical protein [Streptomyces sp. C3-3]|uniref:hypothetical protein n=1 Tax=Streptomyces sp. C3-3 TaxID=2824901 RepID=UPI001B379F17|nr:hypothetical protein [Streptomyces sp. C3-3]MBQ1117325.1 hypothetical protein [Streptomyces sp. C3-3]